MVAAYAALAVPASHSWHTDAFVAPLYVPAPQLVHVAAPPALNVPAGQMGHDEAPADAL